MPTATAPHSSQPDGTDRAPSHRSAGQADSRETGASPGRDSVGRWPLERILFLMAGTMTGLSVILSAIVSPWFLLLTGFVALNQLAFAAVGNCPSSWAMQRYLGVKRASCR